MTIMQNSAKIITGEPPRQGLNAKAVAKYSDVGHVEGYLENGARYSLGYN